METGADHILECREGMELMAQLELAQARLARLERTEGADSLAVETAEMEVDRLVTELAAYGEGEVDQLRRTKEYVSMREVLTGIEGEEDELDDGDMHARVRALKAFLRYCFQDGRISNPWLAFKSFLAITRRIMPEYVAGISATEMALLLGETKAAVSTREIKTVYPLLEKWGVLGFHGLGGGKSEAARKKYRQAARGNTNRRKTIKRKKGAPLKKRAKRKASQ